MEELEGQGILDAQGNPIAGVVTPVAGQVTFSPEQQAYMNGVVSARVNEVRSQYPSKAELDSFKGLKDAGIIGDATMLNDFKTFQSSRPQAELQMSSLQTQLDSFKSTLQSTQSELLSYKNKDVLSNAGVNASFYEFVEFNASKLVGEGKDFSTAVAEFVGANPQYTNVAEVEVPSSKVKGKIVQGVTQNKGPLPNVNVSKGATGFNFQSVAGNDTASAQAEAYLKKRGYKK